MSAIDAWSLISQEHRVPDGVLTDSFVQRFDRYVDWNMLSIGYFFTIEMLRMYFHRVNWEPILKRQTFDDSFLTEMAPSFKNSWGIVSKYQNLSETFIDQHKDEVDWYEILLHQNVSEKFLRKHEEYFKNNIDWLGAFLHKTNISNHHLSIEMVSTASICSNYYNNLFVLLSLLLIAGYN